MHRNPRFRHRGRKGWLLVEQLRSPRGRRGLIAVLAAGMTAAAFAMPSPALGQTPSADGDDQISGQTYVRHDGGTDAGIEHCNNESTQNDGETPAPGPTDSDTTDGGSRRQGNEPFT